MLFDRAPTATLRLPTRVDQSDHHEFAESAPPAGGQRVDPGLVVRRDRLAPGEIVHVGDVRCTSPLRTAYDLGRQEDLVEAVVAVDRLANRHRFPPDLLLHFATH